MAQQSNPRTALPPSRLRAAEDLAFDRLAHFHILARLGAGGMGDVYLAFDAGQRRQVAVKVLPVELARTRLSAAT